MFYIVSRPERNKLNIELSGATPITTMGKWAAKGAPISGPSPPLAKTTRIREPLLSPPHSQAAPATIN